MQKVTPFLWYNGDVKEAATFYTSVFKNATITNITPGPVGMPLAATVNIEGQQLVLFNGGPAFKLNEAFSLSVSCNTQEEIDDLWQKLTADGGQESRCGWLKDKFGLSWQIVPPVLMQLLQHKDPEKANRVMQTMLKMNKLVIADLENA